MRKISAEILIDAPADTVWSRLADFGSWSAWNPFIRIEQGEIHEGAELLVHITPPGIRAMTLRPRILTVELGEELSWAGSLIIPGVFDQKHVFRIVPKTPEQVLFIQMEQFTGILVPLILKYIEANIHRGLEEMNYALKDSIEGQLLAEKPEQALPGFD